VSICQFRRRSRHPLFCILNNRSSYQANWRTAQSFFRETELILRISTASRSRLCDNTHSAWQTVTLLGMCGAPPTTLAEAGLIYEVNTESIDDSGRRSLGSFQMPTVKQETNMKKKIVIYLMFAAVTFIWLPASSSPVRASAVTELSSNPGPIQSRGRSRNRGNKKWHPRRYRNYGQYRRTQVGNRRYRLVRRSYWSDGRRRYRYVRINY
jgi:hypothetical protein